MSSTDTAPTQDIEPRRFGWLKTALILSLAVNLLFIGGGLARFFMDGPPDRFPGGSQLQLIPRKFFGELDRTRKRELLGVFRDYGKAFRDGRKDARLEVVKLADALDAEPYDETKVKDVIHSFSEKSAKLVDTGGEAALTLIAKLTAEERKLLARHIRLRDDGGRHVEGRGGEGRGETRD